METRRSRYRAYRAQIESMPEEEFPKNEGKIEQASPYQTLENSLQEALIAPKKNSYDEYLRKRYWRILLKTAIFLILLTGLLLWYFLRLR